MQNSHNKHSRGLLSNAFGVAKKLSHAGLNFIGQNSPDYFFTPMSSTTVGQVIEGTARIKPIFAAQQYKNPEDMLRKQLPWMTQQLLGRHSHVVNKASDWIPAQVTDKISQYCFQQLNQFSNRLASIDGVLEQAGESDLAALSVDVERSKRLSQALAEQNKWLASIQGVISGATGIVGSSLDIPLCLILSLRTIYQVGRAYGFDLNHPDGQQTVQYIFNHVDLTALAEKHTLLAGIRTVANMLQVHDIETLQQLMGSGNDIEILRKWLTHSTEESKWSWLNHLDLSIFTKLSPVVGATIGATYGWKFIADVNDKAQQVFATARQYQLQYPDHSYDILTAYQYALAAQQQPLSTVNQIDDHVAQRSDDQSPDIQTMSLADKNISELDSTLNMVHSDRPVTTEIAVEQSELKASS
ncbi:MULTISPECIES: EcsC family protein [unclassified Acinetobacter]|uniref:EcsC family protein n=1 Tax=unclassified Acinetobacter TaxID=196816 RepID=UPI0029348351|nr:MULTISPECIES: EcsC family protein [unclassified Acinetobacter]WOE33007.1 EcsC family protein [Acinetobacter sp. SAAs470]WOE38485.1 EcsC family protein [Acinetobacter sp. SAAs474]